MAKQQQAQLERPVRVALLWNGSLFGEELLTTASDVVLGDGPSALFPLPEGVIAESNFVVLEANGAELRFRPHPGMGGYLWLDGRRIAVRELGRPMVLGPGDYGVITFGPVSFFFQQVRPVRGLPPTRSFRDGALAACVGLSIFAHVASLLFLFLVAAREFAPPGSLELDSELMRKFLVVPPPEPEDPSYRRGGTELEDPGLRDRDEMGGKRAEREEGRVGRRNAPKPETEIAGDPKDAIAQKVRGMGLLGVLSGGSSAVNNALDTPSLDSLLGGLGAVQTVVGRGSGGMGLRGQGSGGGGDGPGALFGAGALGTGVGGGKGLGKGKGGIGTRGRKAREVSLSLGGKQAKVNGFLSAEQVNRVVRANRAAIKYCYENALQRQAGLKGVVHVSWQIALSGSVKSARLAKSTLNNSKVEGCIVRQIKRWRFPKPDGGEVAVTYPFFFGSK